MSIPIGTPHEPERCQTWRILDPIGNQGDGEHMLASKQLCEVRKVRRFQARDIHGRGKARYLCCDSLTISSSLRDISALTLNLRRYSLDA